MEVKTTIQVDEGTLQRLKSLRKTRRETYIEILNRLIDNYKGDYDNIDDDLKGGMIEKDGNRSERSDWKYNPD